MLHILTEFLLPNLSAVVGGVAPVVKVAYICGVTHNLTELLSFRVSRFGAGCLHTCWYSTAITGVCLQNLCQWDSVHSSHIAGLLENDLALLHGCGLL